MKANYTTMQEVINRLKKSKYGEIVISDRIGYGYLIKIDKDFPNRYRVNCINTCYGKVYDVAVICDFKHNLWSDDRDEEDRRNLAFTNDEELLSFS